MACLVEHSSAVARRAHHWGSPHLKPALRLIAGGCGWMVESCSYAVRIKYRTAPNQREMCARMLSISTRSCCSPRTEDLVLHRARATLCEAPIEVTFDGFRHCESHVVSLCWQI
jgi:hypothetical protein